MSVICRILFLPVLFVLLYSCGNQSVADGDGSGSETVLGKVTKKNGNPAREASVSLRMVSVDKTGSAVAREFSGTTDDMGRYQLTGIPPGIYILEAEHVSGGAIRSRFKVGEHLPSDADLHLNPPVSLYGRIPGSASLSIQIPGTENTAVTSSDGFFSLAAVNQGVFELMLLKDRIINYIPLEINTDRDTVYIQDIFFSEEKSASSPQIELYETQLNAYSVLPQSYEQKSYPPWYAGRDFSGAAYFSSENGEWVDAGITIPRVMTALFPTDDAQPDSTEQVFINRLERLGVQAVTVWEEFLTLADTAGIDLIVITSGLNDTLIDIPIAEMPIPVWCGETGYYPELFYTEGLHDSTYGRSPADIAINMVRPSHPIAGGFSGLINVSSEPIGFPFGILGPGADVIANHPVETGKSLLFAFEKGNLLVNGVPAPARRVGMFMSSQDAFLWNSSAWTLFDNSILWLTGEM